MVRHFVLQTKSLDVSNVYKRNDARNMNNGRLTIDKLPKYVPHWSRDSVPLTGRLIYVPASYELCLGELVTRAKRKRPVRLSSRLSPSLNFELNFELINS